jgi:hypothetical protein
LSRKYLGKGGIHGIGLSKGQNAIRVHVAPSHGWDREVAARQSALLDELKRDASPYAVLVTGEEAPTISAPAASF